MIDTSIQLNNHNSYHATELFWADPFSVQTMTHITASFALYSDVVQSAADRIKIRFYTASGAIVSETLHAFAVNTIWERVSATVAVPATAEKAQICFLAGSYWWAEAKVEEGQTATPYAINAAGQLTWISPNGIYTGTVTANQVIVSPLSGATEKDLESRLVTINSNAINLKATTDNNVSRLTTIEAGQITLRSDVDGALPKITKLTSSGVYTGEVRADQLTVGQIQGHQLADGTISDIKITSLHGSKIIAESISADKINTTNLTVKRIANPNDALMYAEVGKVDESTSMLGLYRKFNSASTTFQKRFEIVSYANIATVINVPVRTSTEGEGSTVFYITHGDPRLTFWGQPGGGGSATLKSNDAEVVVDALSGVEMNHIGGSVGVDATGPFYITKAGTKKYLT